MSKLEQAIVAIVEVFEEFAGKDDKKSQLSKTELSDLIKSQLSSGPFKDKVDPENIKEVMDDLDKNRDGDVNFGEFSKYVACLAKGYYRKKHGDDKDKPRRNK
ncbi:S100 calcium binding protein W [Triplophysa dalaica]|uniref:S100 calcium binding protein W n=1 Tax=Triplophysa dalaica TaxID=1582913 RepID=UPI0024DF7229|nr:S100 calcium binding protein W [Triplophysa dalaica]